MTNDILKISEGPDFNVGTVSLLIVCFGLVLLRLWRDSRMTDQGLMVMGTAKRAVIPIGVMAIFTLFLFSSAISDLSGWPLMLISHAVISWLFLFATYGLLYEAICRLGSVFRIRLWTSYVSVNVALKNNNIKITDIMS